MLFTSILYLLFLPSVLLVYHHVGPAVRRPMLLAASWLFYAVYNPWFFGVILATTSVDWIAGGAIAKTTDSRRRKLWVLCSVASNLGLLGYFKYSAFAASNLSLLGSWLHADLARLAWRAGLPLGISFHTFQGISYTIDVYRREITPISSFWKFALFVSFFPQLVAGPIVRAPELVPQIDFRSEPDSETFRRGIGLIIYGMFKKVYVADVMANWVSDAYADPIRFSGLGLLGASLAFSVQIYCDFSGYSDIAIGSAALFGVRLPENFRAPYLATSIRDFWQRWHMTLSRWLRDYLYIPLGGNRGGVIATYVNLMITMVLGGLWHGAGWNWVAWGAIQGVVMSVERATGFDRTPSSPIVRGIRRVITFAIVLISWIFFRSRSLSEAGLVLERIITWQTGDVNTDVRCLTYALVGISFVIAADLVDARERWLRWCATRDTGLRWAVYASVVTLALTFARATHQEFVYFAF